MKELTKKNKELVLIDISARLPYGIYVKENHESLDDKPTIYTLDYHPWIDTCKPYLRSMSSMTDEEKREYRATLDVWQADYCAPEYIESIKSYDWLNAHGFDYRGLIEKGLAIKVTEDNNPYKIQK